MAAWHTAATAPEGHWGRLTSFEERDALVGGLADELRSLDGQLYDQLRVVDIVWEEGGRGTIPLPGGLSLTLDLYSATRIASASASLVADSAPSPPQLPIIAAMAA